MESKNDRWIRDLELNKEDDQGGGDDAAVVEVQIWTEDERVAANDDDNDRCEG